MAHTQPGEQWVLEDAPPAIGEFFGGTVIDDRLWFLAQVVGVTPDASMALSKPAASSARRFSASLWWRRRAIGMVRKNRTSSPTSPSNSHQSRVRRSLPRLPSTTPRSS